MVNGGEKSFILDGNGVPIIVPLIVKLSIFTLLSSSIAAFDGVKTKNNNNEYNNFFTKKNVFKTLIHRHIDIVIVYRST